MDLLDAWNALAAIARHGTQLAFRLLWATCDVWTTLLEGWWTQRERKKRWSPEKPTDLPAWRQR
ncbi:hypothetical protein [Brevibacillus brevis]|uniref:Uncharacterized protein n=1 Tax=Brevibacillus brevis TaxID=1393 RepID=A0ABY9SXA7_BREBE|nr:hypothetical protein [Brevibacillus brevis]WNC12348.1 hypothetical protein RGB73_16570 [Brevibacillus brevis]